ncbi:hypothetical protein QAD02_004675 [Eretmocerus hayati]|uniref:Uncharacterized protein n=1 Tax=Eretmocerus hayati TaxID=131215 RepID=A0ACC2NRF1_9HYME|nr:hypothetical protein QAD02_004675 [Eretmocerus hayati]
MDPPKNSRRRKSNNPRARGPKSPPMSELESDIWMDIIKKHRHVVENTASNAYSKVQKANTWLIIASEYAEATGKLNIRTPRSAKQLKTYWKNTKSKVRKVDSDVKQYRLDTGGGPDLKVDPKIEDLTSRVKSIAPKIDFTLENKWDSTSAFEQSDNEDSEDDLLDDDESSSDEIINSRNSDQDPNIEKSYKIRNKDFTYSNHNNVKLENASQGESKSGCSNEDIMIVPNRSYRGDISVEAVIDLVDEPENSISESQQKPQVNRRSRKMMPVVKTSHVSPIQSSVDVSAIKMQPETVKISGRGIEKFEKRMKLLKPLQPQMEIPPDSMETTQLGKNKGAARSETITSQHSYDPVVRSPLKSVPQAEAISATRRASFSYKGSRAPRNYAPVEIKNEFQDGASPSCAEFEPLQRRLALCQENIRPGRTKDYAGMKEEIYQKEIVALQPKTKYWELKCEGATLEFDAQLINKQAAEMKLQYYQSKCANEGVQFDEQNQVYEEADPCENAQENENLQADSPRNE